MILTVGQYIEALANSDGRFRTLGKIYPVADAAGNPVFSMPGHGLADFEVMAGDVRLSLRCPLRSDAGTANKLRALREKDRGLGSRFFREWALLEKEIVLFDAAGNPVEADILARPVPQSERVADFLQRMAAESLQDRVPVVNEDGEEESYKEPREKILDALASFGELAGWAQGKGLRIAVRKLLVTCADKVFVTGFSADDSSPMIALAFLFTAAMPERFADAGLPLISGAAGARPLAEKLCAAASEAGFPESAQMLAGDVAGAVRRLSERSPEEICGLGREISSLSGASDKKTKEDTPGYAWSADDSEGIKCVRDGAGWRYVDRRNRPVIDMVWQHAAPFREGRAEVETASGKGLIDKEGRLVLEPVYEELAWDEYCGIVAVMTEGRWSLLDREGILLTTETYDWLGECCEGLILVQKDGKCGFIDAEGREVIPLIYDDATSFSEGCAFVTAGGESFYIDSKGKRL